VYGSRRIGVAACTTLLLVSASVEFGSCVPSLDFDEGFDDPHVICVVASGAGPA